MIDDLSVTDTLVLGHLLGPPNHPICEVSWQMRSKPSPVSFVKISVIVQLPHIVCTESPQGGGRFAWRVCVRHREAGKLGPQRCRQTLRLLDP